MTTPLKPVVKPITLLRIAIAPVICAPLQWSDNSQLAINGNDQLALVEPMINSLHQSVLAIGAYVILLPREIFSSHKVLDTEIIETLPLRKVSSLAYPNYDEPFHLRNISEPHIVQHAWAPVDPFTHNCLLGALFSTGELLLLDRQNLLTHTCAVKHVMFDELLYEFNVTIERQEAIIQASQLSCLKIKSFAFSLLDPLPIQKSLLSVITASGTILIYALHNGATFKLDKLLRIDTGLEIVRQEWSLWVKREDGALYSMIALCDSGNRVQIVQMRYDVNSGELAASLLIQLSSSLRFLVQTLKWCHLSAHSSVLVCGATGGMTFFNIGNALDCTHTSAPLDSFAAIAGIISNVEGSVLDCTVAHENGQFQSVKYDINSGAVSPSKPNTMLELFVERAMYNFQMADAGADDDDETNVKSDTQVLSKVDLLDLQLDSECRFICHGMTLDKNGCVTLAYRTTARNAVHYQTMSQRQVQVVIIRVQECLLPISKSLDVSAIGHINQLWLSSFESVPVPQDVLQTINSTITETDIIGKYIEELKAYKATHFVDVDSTGTVPVNASSDLAYSLVSNFSHTRAVKEMQYLNSFNRVLIECLRQWAPDHDSVQLFVLVLEAESEQAEKFLNRRLSTLVLEYAVANRALLQTEEDEFVIIKHYHQLASIDIEAANRYKDQIPQSATITVESKFFAETFTASVHDRHTSDALVVSDTKHRWTRCQLTHMPLLQMNHRKNEMRQLNYLTREDDAFQKSPLLTQLLDTINYCYLTGTRIFNLH